MMRPILCDSCSGTAEEVPEHWSAEKVVRLCSLGERRCAGCNEIGVVSVSEDGEAAELVFRVK